MSNTITNIDQLPSMDEVLKRSRALALLDAILMPEWEYRYFSFNSRWNIQDGEMMASMRDGEGGEYFLLFSGNGVAGKVLDGHCAGDAIRYLASVPELFANFKGEPAFRLLEATLYFWRNRDADKWTSAPESPVSYGSLGFLTGGSSYYRSWAEDYYERPINSKALEDVFNSLTVNPQQLAILNPERTLESLKADLDEIFGDHR